MSYYAIIMVKIDEDNGIEDTDEIEISKEIYDFIHPCIFFGESPCH